MSKFVNEISYRLLEINRSQQAVLEVSRNFILEELDSVISELLWIPKVVGLRLLCQLNILSKVSVWNILSKVRATVQDGMY